MFVGGPLFLLCLLLSSCFAALVPVPGLEPTGSDAGDVAALAQALQGARVIKAEKVPFTGVRATGDRWRVVADGVHVGDIRRIDSLSPNRWPLSFQLQTLGGAPAALIEDNAPSSSNSDFDRGSPVGTELYTPAGAPRGWLHLKSNESVKLYDSDGQLSFSFEWPILGVRTIRDASGADRYRLGLTNDVELTRAGDADEEVSAVDALLVTVMELQGSDSANDTVDVV